MQEGQIISDSELKSLLHPTERSRFVLALIVAIPAAAVLVWLMIITAGIVLAIAAVAVFTVWFVLRVFEAHLVGNSVRICADNFPEVHEAKEEIRRRLNFRKPIEIYISDGTEGYALLYRFFRTKFIMLHSDVVEGMASGRTRSQLVWLIARFIGALKAKHFRLQILMMIYTAIEDLRVFNLFMVPYERATQYSGDQIGLAVCGDLDGAIEAFGKLMVGKGVGGRVRIKGLLPQAYDVHGSLFGLLSKLLSTHPHLTDRYLNLIAFARYRYPKEFARYVGKFDDTTVTWVEALLPPYFPVTGTFAAQSSGSGNLGPSFSGTTEAEFAQTAEHEVLLVGVGGMVNGRRYPIDRSTFYIGADGSNDLVLGGDEFISGSHAFVTDTQSQLLLVDDDSTNGTWLNGQRVSGTGTPINDGDRIRIGSCTFEVQEETLPH